jgi:predicted DCC family thiol-disulfide oxidoreductase YuxK
VTRVPLVYDPDCGFCRLCVALLLAWDRRARLRPVPLGSEEANRLLAGIPHEEQMASWHLITPSGKIRSAGTAFLPLLRMLPAGRPLAWLTARFPQSTEAGYAWAAAHRSTLGRAIPRPVGRWAEESIRRRSRPN